MRLLLTISLALWLLGAQADGARILVQNSPLAGAQYYELAGLLAEIRVGDALELIREPENRHDARAIRVEWRGHKLGYVPRAENAAISAAMDRGDQLTARVSSLNDDKNPWRRLGFEVYVAL